MNSLDNVLKMLQWAAGIVLTVALVSLAVWNFQHASELAGSGRSAVVENQDVASPQWQVYDGQTVTGSEVFSMIGRFPDFNYTIVTPEYPDGFSSTEASNDSVSEYFVNPQATFSVRFEYDTRGATVEQVVVVQSGVKDAEVYSTVEADATEEATTEASIFYQIRKYAEMQSGVKLEEVLEQGGPTEEMLEQVRQRVATEQARNLELQQRVLRGGD